MRNKKVIVINKDFLKYDITKFNNIIIISNLPYNILNKIILKLLYFNKQIEEMIL